ncbi:DUF2955 domain-containing protein [Mesorhizobium ventifaucium]|uniref:DUF2955 domain-containing protein n=1 Tax=Mesorhizobium ventifaucium TaxID=666020 RepID=A0ABN8JYR1_9HYPH|nr:DUF2955 domain-containing protein [Mesorhizobium ventifaucium]CAH2402080.1 conserved membrane hypothetical protein [Mesorhizobium ventifaucium]
MPADGNLAHANAKRKGLRIALAVAVGFTWSVLSGAIIPFLGPLFAAQFLISSSRPLPPQKALGMAVIIVVAGALLQAVAVLTGDRPPVLLLLLGLVYFVSFYLQANGKGGGAIFLVLVVAVMVPLLTVLNRDLGDSILSILVQGVVSGTILMWIAHAVIPDRGSADIEAPDLAANPRAARYAAANAAILLIAVLACLTQDGLATAIVIPITVASLLSQLDVSASAKTAFGLVLVNLIGGVSASLAFALLQVRPTAPSLFVLVLLAGLVFGGRAALGDPAAKLYAGALTIFLVVFGIGVSPLPVSAAESFSTRVSYILVAITYTIFMAALLWPGARRSAEDRVLS